MRRSKTSLLKLPYTPYLPPKFCVSIVSNFSWDDCNIQERWRTKVMQNCGWWGVGGGRQIINNDWTRLSKISWLVCGEQVASRSRLCSLRPDFGRNADWLLEQCHKIWLAIRNTGSWKRLFARVVAFVNDPPWAAERRIDFAVYFIVLWSYGRKICLNMCRGNSENSYGCSYLLRICSIYGLCECIAELNPSASCWPLTRCLLINR